MRPQNWRNARGPSPRFLTDTDLLGSARLAAAKHLFSVLGDATTTITTHFTPLGALSEQSDLSSRCFWRPYFVPWHDPSWHTLGFQRNCGSRARWETSLDVFLEVGPTTTAWVPVHPLANRLLPRRGSAALTFACGCVQVASSAQVAARLEPPFSVAWAS